MFSNIGLEMYFFFLSKTASEKIEEMCTSSMFSPPFTASSQNSLRVSEGSLEEGKNKAVLECDVTKLGDVRVPLVTSQMARF